MFLLFLFCGKFEEYWYKFFFKNLIAFLYTDDKWAEKEIREALCFTIATKSINCLGVTLNKQMEDPYDKIFEEIT